MRPLPVLTKRPDNLFTHLSHEGPPAPPLVEATSRVCPKFAEQGKQLLFSSIHTTPFLSLNMEISHIDLATAQAASLVIDHLRRQLNDLAAPPHKLEAALITAFVIRWIENVIRRGGTGRLAKILRAMRNSKRPDSAYNKVRGLWVLGLSNDRSFPKSRATWRTLIERIYLDGETPWDI